jgi:STE24 endopeptidase
MNETKATRYQRLKRRAHVAGTTAGGLAVAIVALSPSSRLLADWSAGLGEGMPVLWREAVALSAMVVTLVAIWEIAAVPAMAYLARRAERRYTPGDATIDEVLLARVESAIIAVPIVAVVAVVWRLSVTVSPGWWFAGAGVILAALLGLALRGAPSLLGALASAKPIGDARLAARLSDIARTAGVPVRSIEEWRIGRGSGRSALVAGAGRGRRVLISSEIVRDWSHDEIAVVVAHELAHHRHRDLWRALALDAAILSAATFAADAVVRPFASILGLSGPADLAALPLLLLAGGAVWLAATPIRHAQSRRHERRADALALSITGGADAFSAAIRRLGAHHLVEEQPSILTRVLFDRHPSIADRLELAEQHRQTQSKTF